MKEAAPPAKRAGARFGGIGYERPLFRLPAQHAGADRDRPAGRLSDRLFGVDQPAQIQPEAPTHLRVHRPRELPADPSNRRSSGRRSGSRSQFTCSWSRRRPCSGFCIALLLNQTIFRGRDIVRTLILAAVGDTAGRQRPDVAVDLRLEDRRAERPAGQPRHHQRIPGLAVGSDVGAPRAGVRGRVERAAARRHPAACRAAEDSGRAL